MVTEYGSVLDQAGALEAALRDEQPDAARRLRRSVIRPLGQALGREPSGAVAEPPSLWRLTLDATRLRVASDAPAELQEATAALQDLALRDESERAARLEELKAIQSPLPRAIQSQTDGPYLVTNVEELTDWLGERVAARPQMALCRCGGSQLKPFCDGTHAEIGFSGEKDPGRVPDRRDTYVGQQVTVLDNRGICQHSGFCTDRLATAFRVGQDPFVAPSGGRMDEIIRAVRDCPSGALSYAIDGVEARGDVDFHDSRAPAIEVTKDGPYRVTGGIPLTGDEPACERAPRASTTRCAGAGTRRTSRSAAACTGTSTSRTRCPTRSASRRCSNGPAGCRH